MSSMLTHPKVIDEEKPRGDRVLARAIRRWLTRQTKVATLPPAQSITTRFMLEDLENKKLILKFASSTPYTRHDIGRSNFHFNDDEILFIELHTDIKMQFTGKPRVQQAAALNIVAAEITGLYHRAHKRFSFPASTPAQPRP